LTIAPEVPAGYQLRLFVAGATPRSVRTIGNLRRLCERHLGAMTFEVIDIYQHPALAIRDQVVAAPTLVKLAPAPIRRVIGDLSDEPGALRALGLLPNADER
jgi:circadian clock protein KaiB